MKLVVGGFGNGKLEHVLEMTGLTMDSVARGFDEAGKKPVFYGLQDEVRKALAQGQDPEALMDKALAENPGLIVICDEVGSGVVPVEKEERRYREAVGRLCCRLAVSAGRVERVVCGIAMVLKGEEEWR